MLDRSGDVWNVYGPTETTIWSSATRVLRGAGALPIGPPIANTTFFVLDERQQPVPLGVTGELYIGGVGLARGYWRRPELTTEKFIESRFGNGRLYRTGDLARWRRDGSMELLGRADFQVKIRGYRIELGEIEAAMATHPLVREAVVIQHNSRLVGFFENTDPQTPENESLLLDIQQLLKRSLPEYMTPATLISLRDMPRTPNGKVDRRVLQQLSATDPLSLKSNERTFVAPTTSEEKRLCTIWSEVLELEEISVTDSIFELGADSLLIFRIAARAQRQGISLNATQIFQYRNIRAICESLQQKADNVSPVRVGSRIAAASRDSYRHTKVS